MNPLPEFARVPVRLLGIRACAEASLGPASFHGSVKFVPTMVESRMLWEQPNLGSRVQLDHHDRHSIFASFLGRHSLVVLRPESLTLGESGSQSHVSIPRLALLPNSGYGARTVGTMAVNVTNAYGTLARTPHKTSASGAHRVRSWSALTSVESLMCSARRTRCPRHRPYEVIEHRCCDVGSLLDVLQVSVPSTLYSATSTYSTNSFTTPPIPLTVSFTASVTGSSSTHLKYLLLGV